MSQDIAAVQALQLPTKADQAMMPDPDSALERPETSSVPSDLPESDHRAIQAAVAGAAGLLLGRVIFGRAGGLAAGLAAVGAGLLARRKPPVPGSNGLNESAAMPAADPLAAPVVASAAALEPTAPAPVMNVRLEAPSSVASPAWLPVMLESPASSAFVFQPAIVETSEPTAVAAAVSGAVELEAPLQAEPEVVAVVPSPDSAVVIEEGIAAVEPEVEAVAAEALEPAAGEETVGILPSEKAEIDTAALVIPAAPEEPAPPASETAPVPAVRDELDDPDAFAEVPALFVPFSEPSPPVASPPPAAVSEETAGDIVLPEQAVAGLVGEIIQPQAPPLEPEPPEAGVPLLETAPVAAPPLPAASAAVAEPLEVLIEKAAGALETEQFPEDRAVAGLAKPPVVTTPVLTMLGPLGELPDEFVVQEQEEAPGPRDGFLLVPDEPRESAALPAIEPVIAALADAVVPEPMAELVSAAAISPEPEPVSFVKPPPEPEATALAEDGKALPEEIPPGPIAVSLPGAATAPIQLLGPATPARADLTVPPAVSPFVPWQPPSAPIPAPAPVKLQTAPVWPVPLTPAPVVPLPAASAASPAATPEPEEIWRQAAQEITASPLGEGPLQADARAASMAGYKPDELPAWLRNIASAAPVAERPGHDPAAHKAFLPTIKLSLPQGPQPLSARRPVPVAPAEPAPVKLPGYKAEPLSATQPVPVPPETAPAPAAPIPPMPLPAMAPPVAVAPAPLPEVPEIDLEPELEPPPARAAAGSPFALPGASGTAGSTVPPVFSGAGEEKVFVPRTKSVKRRTAPVYRRPLVTPFRVGVLAILAAGALAVAFKSELQRIWEERIQGKVPKKSRPAEVVVPTETSGVSIAPDKPVTAPAPAPQPVTPVPAPAPAAEPVAPAPPVEEALEDPAPPPAAGVGSAEIPQNEKGAREILGRLLQATSPAQVRPFILDEARVGPGLESYFSSGRAVPVASHTLTLEQSRPAANGHNVWLFRVITDNVPRGFPAGVEATPEGLKVDWEIFTQCRDSALKRFAGDPKSKPELFFVALRKKHIFDDVLPASEQSKFLAFALHSPAMEDPPLIAFIRTGTPLAARAEKLYEFNNLYSPVVELTHRDGKVEITGIVRENWRNFTGPGISRNK